MRRRIRVERSLPILKCRVPRILSLHEFLHIVTLLTLSPFLIHEPFREVTDIMPVCVILIPAVKRPTLLSCFREFSEGRSTPQPMPYSGKPSNISFGTSTSAFPSLLSAARLHADQTVD